MGEFDLIARIKDSLESVGPPVVLGMGDDAAILDLPVGESLVVSSDTLNADIHFPANTAAEKVGHKVLAVSLSDLASMGAKPRWVMLNISLPELDLSWCDSFMEGFRKLARAHDVALVGGDTCCGPLSFTVTALGTVTPGREIRRTGASPGDLVVISGAVGDAALALQYFFSSGEVSVPLSRRLDQPEPRVSLGLALAGHASACIDISDGLASDLSHVLKASACSATIELDQLPASAQVSRLKDEDRWAFQLGGGDDYELCFTLPPQQEAWLGDLEKSLEIPLSVIGEIKDGSGLKCLRPDGSILEPLPSGFEHFQELEIEHE